MFLRMNREALAPYGRISARDELSASWRTLAMRHVKRARTPPEAPFAAEAARMRETMSRAGDDTVVIADENLIGNRLFTADGRTLFDWAAWFLPVLEGAFEGVEVEHVFLTREREHWLRSCYSQAVRKQGETRDWEAWCAAMPPELNWAEGEARIRSAVRGSVTFVDLEDDLFGEAPGTTVLDRLGVPPDVRERLARPERHYNVSPVEVSLERRRLRNASQAAEGAPESPSTSE